jgi:hypothetical protein
MREAGFSYEAHKECYYVDRHEEDDIVIADRHVYIDEDRASKIDEHCWIQLPEKQYLKFKFKFKFKWRIQSIRVKKKEERKSQISKQKFITFWTRS